MTIPAIWTNTNKYLLQNIHITMLLLTALAMFAYYGYMKKLFEEIF